MKLIKNYKESWILLISIIIGGILGLIFKENIKIYAKIVYNEEVVKNAYKVNEFNEIHEEIAKKIREINSLMPKYKAIRGFTLTTKPLIKTTTNKIKRKQNLEIILEEEKNAVK